MRILQVSPDSYVNYGGISVHIKNISERLARDHDVTVYATNNRMLLPRFEMQSGVKVERFRCYAPSNAYFFTWEMLLRMRQVEFDIVHAHGYHAFPFHLASVTKCKGFFVTPHFHGMGHSSFRNALIRVLRPFGRHALRKADKIIAVSEYEKSLLCDQFKFNPSKIAVIPNGVNFSEFANLKRREKKFRSILYAGYLDSYKGVQYLVEVLPKLEKDVILEIIGRGPLKPYLEQRAKELGVNSRIRFYSYLPRAEFLQKIVDANVFAILSKYEAYSIVVAEAITAGTPCIVTNVSALSEWIDNSRCFGVEYPISLSALAKKLEFISNNQSDKRKKRKIDESKILDWDAVAARLQDIYKEAI
jgi:glycosyltransferase involved in cell wall biosynthesis